MSARAAASWSESLSAESSHSRRSLADSPAMRVADVASSSVAETSGAKARSPAAA